jgi:hypothetical protein
MEQEVQYAEEEAAVGGIAEHVNSLPTHVINFN